MFSIYFDFSQAITPFYLIVPVLDTNDRHHLKGKAGGGGAVIVIILLCCHLFHLWKKKTFISL